MKAALGILTAVALLSFLYFFFAALFAFGQARAERKPSSYSTSSLLSTIFLGGSYTDRGKEWFARFSRCWFFGFVSGVVMVMSGASYVHLRDGAVGPHPFKSPLFLAVPVIVFVTALIGFLGSTLWLLVSLVGAALRKLRNESTSDAQRRWIIYSVQWTAGCFVLAALSLVIMRHQ